MNLTDVLTPAEAVELYNITESSIRRACTGQKGYKPIFKETECRKSGKTWLITRSGMERVYGARKRS